MVELHCLHRKTSLDVAQALPIGKLGEGHATELFGATQRSHAVIAAITSYDAAEGGPRQVVHELRKKDLAGMHRSLRGTVNRTLMTLLANSHHLLFSFLIVACDVSETFTAFILSAKREIATNFSNILLVSCSWSLTVVLSTGSKKHVGSSLIISPVS